MDSRSYARAGHDMAPIFLALPSLQKVFDFFPISSRRRYHTLWGDGAGDLSLRLFFFSLIGVAMQDETTARQSYRYYPHMSHPLTLLFALCAFSPPLRPPPLDNAVDARSP